MKPSFNAGRLFWVIGLVASIAIGVWVFRRFGAGGCLLFLFVLHLIVITAAIIWDRVAWNRLPLDERRSSRARGFTMTLGATFQITGVILLLDCYRTRDTAFIPFGGVCLAIGLITIWKTRRFPRSRRVMATTRYSRFLS